MPIRQPLMLRGIPSARERQRHREAGARDPEQKPDGVKVRLGMRKLPANHERGQREQQSQ